MMSSGNRGARDGFEGTLQVINSHLGFFQPDPCNMAMSQVKKSCSSFHFLAKQAPNHLYSSASLCTVISPCSLGCIRLEVDDLPGRERQVCRVKMFCEKKQVLGDFQIFTKLTPRWPNLTKSDGGDWNCAARLCFKDIKQKGFSWEGSCWSIGTQCPQNPQKCSWLWH